MSVRSEEHEPDVENYRHGDQLITKEEVLGLVLHDVLGLPSLDWQSLCGDRHQVQQCPTPHFV
jgi:hypothetical protein